MLGGFDFVHLDGEQGLFSPESIDEMCRVADGFGLTVTARVPDISGSTINSFLDRGVTGIADRIHAAGGKLRTDLMAMIELRHLIVDGAQQFLADNV